MVRTYMRVIYMRIYVTHVYMPRNILFSAWIGGVYTLYA